MTKKILPVLIKLAALELLVLLFLAFFTFGDDPTDVYAQVGAQCRFDQAKCSWDAVGDATSYAITITEEESNSVIKQETVAAGTTKYVFDITANKTYRCDVSAVNACGTLGPAGSASALCAAEGVASAAPTAAPTAAPVVTPAPTAAPVATPRPQVACGSSCSSTADCLSGLTCLKIANGESYCARPEYQTACVSNPTIASCCQAPLPRATELPRTGLVEDTLMIFLFGIAVAVLGIGGILFTSRKRG